ncbi:MAG: HDIG domain-containing protein, partial [Armatimonadetes bacterium]|nr:HDIG domain-containing protein [Armatimonadota bacterium]
MPSENPVLQILRDALRGTEYENRVYLVGGYVRDKIMGRVGSAALDDIDLVLEGDASALAQTLWRKRISWHKPVEFPTFGTAMVRVGGTGTETPGVQVEIVTAREETYRHGSRKPEVVPGTLATDALRRDFTVNTFLENLHTGDITDPTDKGYADLQAGLLRTPLDPVLTFTDDPLRMLRAARFAAKLGFSIELNTLAAIGANAFRLSPEHGISFERVRDELVKTLPTQGAAQGLELMRETGLLSQFAPELAVMQGVTQNRFHLYDVWEHTLVALSNLPPDADTGVRLAMLFHDVGKSQTRTVDANGDVHFYEHEKVGAEITRTVMTRLKFSGDEIARVVALVGLHMRYGAYNPDEWTDASVRRLIRTVGEYRTDLFTIVRADISACNTTDYPTADLSALQERMEAIENEASITTATSPLSGEEIMARLALPAGRIVGTIKNALTDAVVAG